MSWPPGRRRRCRSRRPRRRRRVRRDRRPAAAAARGSPRSGSSRARPPDALRASRSRAPGSSGRPYGQLPHACRRSRAPRRPDRSADGRRRGRRPGCRPAVPRRRPPKRRAAAPGRRGRRSSARGGDISQHAVGEHRQLRMHVSQLPARWTTDPRRRRRARGADDRPAGAAARPRRSRSHPPPPPSFPWSEPIRDCANMQRRTACMSHVSGQPCRSRQAVESSRREPERRGGARPRGDRRPRGGRMLSRRVGHPDGRAAGDGGSGLRPAARSQRRTRPAHHPRPGAAAVAVLGGTEFQPHRDPGLDPAGDLAVRAAGASRRPSRSAPRCRRRFPVSAGRGGGTRRGLRAT